MNDSQHLWLIPLLPFAGFVINGLLGRKLPRLLVSAVALFSTLIPFCVVLDIVSHFRSLTLPYVERLSVPWIQAGTFHADFALSLDHLTLVMLLIVTGVGFLIHVYSTGYMAEEQGYWRFFSYLNLFMFFMSVLVLAENYLLMFVGWEGVGLASYLLIGFYYDRNSAADAGKKAFVVNRIGDFGFLIAMFLLIAHFGSLSFSTVGAQIAAHPEWQGGFLTAVALFLILGATGKSAQIPLYVWLPDAMEGPTPVSALIHAATMVTAGIYMVVRTHVIFDRSPVALGVVAVIGAATAFFAATIGLVQTDIKRVLAYSTVSQLGYMFLGCGVAAYSAAIFHLVTHAFFKALLFLAAGSVIHALSGEQDLRVMGGLRKKIPVTFWTMTAGVFAIAGFWPFAGFFSKDAILYAAYQSGRDGVLLWFVGIITALMTTFYMFRLWYLTFFGDSRAQEAHASSQHGSGHNDHSHGVHESPWIMLAPLVILAVLSVCGGWIGSERFGEFLNPTLYLDRPVPAPLSRDHSELIFSVIAVAVAALGWFLADLFYRRNPELPKELAARFSGLYNLLLGKYWIDELYKGLIVTPILVASRYLLGMLIDSGVITGSAHLLALTAQGSGSVLRRIQSGNLRSYAGWLAAGAAIVLLLAYFGHGTYLKIR
jgi:NADH-quinone oxidoreductase subunit L